MVMLFLIISTTALIVAVCKYLKPIKKILLKKVKISDPFSDNIVFEIDTKRFLYSHILLRRMLKEEEYDAEYLKRLIDKIDKEYMISGNGSEYACDFEIDFHVHAIPLAHLSFIASVYYTEYDISIVFEDCNKVIFMFKLR